AVDRFEIISGVVPAADVDLLADVGFDPLDTDRADLRPDVIEHRGANHVPAHARNGQGHDPAHRSADEDSAGDTELVQQVDHVAGKGGGHIIGRAGTTIRLSGA